MNEPADHSHCLNCGALLHGKFCGECGQKQLDDDERTLKHLFYQFLGSAFFLENNFFKNLWYLLARPGRQALDFIEGRRKRWMPPFSLFLLVNLFYFWYTPLSDYNLRLGEQLHQPHAFVANDMVNKRLKERSVTYEEYAQTYNAKSSAYSNSLIIIHIPLFAFFVSLLYLRKNYFFADFFVYGLYFFAFVLLSSLLISYIIIFVDQLFRDFSGLLSILLYSSTIIYAMTSLKKVFSDSWMITSLKLFPVLAIYMGVHFIYRAILFFIIFAVT
jgi:Protein of unknown function (DUF3667)